MTGRQRAARLSLSVLLLAAVVYFDFFVLDQPLLFASGVLFFVLFTLLVLLVRFANRNAKRS